MFRKVIGTIAVASLVVLSACATPSGGGPDAERGMISAVRGIGHLILSPIQIAAGVAEGVAALPYYAGTSLKAINEGLVSAQAKISLDDTYESAYGKRLDQVSESGDTGEVFRRMRHASDYFQKVLKRYGVPDPQNYILTSIDTANNQGYTLFAVVYRPTRVISVTDKYDGKTIRNFTSEDRLYYEPFASDTNGKPVDTIIDWAGVPTDQVKTQRQQALLLTLAANAVAEGRKRTDYWDAEKRWIGGQFAAVIKEQEQRVDGKLKVAAQ